MKKFALALLAACAAAFVVFQVGVQVSAQEQPGISPAEVAQAKSDFNGTCAACHGEDAGGGDRAPSLIGNAHLRALDAAGIATIIRTGQRAMPPFPNLPPAELTRIAAWLHSENISGLQAAPPEQVAAGEAYFFGAGGCSGCHMVRGRGGSNGPDLSAIAARSTRPEMERWLDNPTSLMGTKSLNVCPGWAFCADFQWAVQDVSLKSGEKLRGFARRRTEHEVALQTLDGKFCMLPRPDRLHHPAEDDLPCRSSMATPTQRRDLLAYLATLGGINAGPLQHAAPPVTPAEIEGSCIPSRATGPAIMAAGTATITVRWTRSTPPTSRGCSRNGLSRPAVSGWKASRW